VQGRCPVERRRIPLTPRASRVAAVVTGARHGKPEIKANNKQISYVHYN